MCSVICRRASTARCDRTTAFGSPDVPEVKMIRAVSSSSGLLSPGASPSGVCTGAIAQGPQRDPAGIFAAAGASARVRAGSSAASPFAISAALHHVLASTGTAPAHRHAQKFTTHSGLFQPRMKTRSPRFTPKSCNSATLARTAICMSSNVRTRSPWMMCGRVPQRVANMRRSSTRRGRSTYMR